MGTTGIAYGLIGCFFLGERALRHGNAAKSLDTGRADHGTTRDVGTAIGLSAAGMLAAPLLNHARIGRLAAALPAWSGVAAMLAGLALRVWAMHVLGSAYTRTLRTTPEQRLVAEGPYRLIRHPGYLGTLMVWIGGGLATANWIIATVIALCMGRAYRQRLQAEEAMLAATFRDAYPRYARRTWRLIPYIY